MAEIALFPGKPIPKLSPGDTLLLKQGRWRVSDADRWRHHGRRCKPALALSGIRGTATDPVYVRGEGNVFLDGGSEFEPWRTWSNTVAHKIWRKHWAGKVLKEGLPYPGVHKIAGTPEGALLHLRDCEHVVIDELDLRGAYPTLCLLENCRNVVVRKTTFSAGTFAISIRGGSDVTVEKCRWRQDGWLWRVIAWNRVHFEGIEGEIVDVASDFRNYDGSFINAEDMTGKLIVHRCDVGDAFNGVHLFTKNTKTKLVVTKCRFTRIRDNAIEIEGDVENALIANNRFVDPYRPISIDTFQRIGWFYFYGNLSWFVTPPGPKTDQNNGGEFFKLPKLKKNPTATGPSYVFHNSLVLRSSWAKRGVWPRLTAFGNAIDYPRPDEPWGPGVKEPPPEIADRMAAPYFGSLALTGDGNQRFTTDWAAHDIRFFDEAVDHHEVPQVLLAAGYGAGNRFEVHGGGPGFRAPTIPNRRGTHLKLDAARPNCCRKTSIQAPDRGDLKLPDDRNIGAWQGDKLFNPPSLRRLKSFFESGGATRTLSAEQIADAARRIEVLEPPGM